MAKPTPKSKPKIANRRGGAWDPSRLTQVQLAGLVGVSGPAVTKWGARGCPRNADGTYDLPAVCRWIRTGGMDLEHLPQSEMLRLLDVSKPTIGEFEKRGMPRNADSSYDAVACVAWRLKELATRATDARRLSEREQQQVRQARLQNERLEIELAERRGEKLDRDAVLAGWGARISTLRAQLMALCGRLPSAGLTPEHAHLVEDELVSLLRQYASGQVILSLDPILGDRISSVIDEFLRGPVAPWSNAAHWTEGAYAPPVPADAAMISAAGGAEASDG